MKLKTAKTRYNEFKFKQYIWNEYSLYSVEPTLYIKIVK